MQKTNSAFILCVVLSAAGVQAQRPAASHALSTDSLSTIALVKANEGHAVVRAEKSGLTKVKVGDVVGATRALVKEITAGRLVLEETFSEKDGKPNRALIVIKEGERGGTRYLQRPDKPQM